MAFKSLWLFVIIHVVYTFLDVEVDFSLQVVLHHPTVLKHQNNYLKGNFVIFYMLAKYVPGDIKYIFTKFYRHISTNNEANRKLVILISNFFMGCDVLAR
jgi:hypothetical protein